MLKSTSYRPELDGIRALCIVFTVAGHVPDAMPFVNGSVGVDVFFALSGWLITSLLIAERQNSGEINIGAYYIRRIFRIVPLYFVTIFLYFVASYLMLVVFGKAEEVAEFFAGLPYFLTFNGEYMAHRDGLLFGHSWTLGIEEKFYIVWPLALIFLGSQRIGMLAAATALAVAALMLPASNPELLIRGYVGLAAGAFAAVAASRSPAFTRMLSHSSVRGLAVASLVVTYTGSLYLPLTYGWNLMVSVCAVPLIANLWIGGEQGRLASLLRWAPLAAAGRLTYAVYLTHVLVINVVHQALQFAESRPSWWLVFAASYSLSLLVGFVLHVTIEKPLISIGRRLSKRPMKGLPAIA